MLSNLMRMFDWLVFGLGPFTTDNGTTGGDKGGGGGGGTGDGSPPPS